VRLALVVQRYGEDFSGGAEAHCRSLAQRLSARHEITVLASCARDYLTWENHYPAGEDRDAEVRVLRFEAQPRRPQVLREISERVWSGHATRHEERRWFEENGPVTPGLHDYLKTHGDEYDRVLFWTYRYWQTWDGLPLVADRAILVPTAERDWAIRMGVLGEFFRLPRGYIFLTPEEQALVEDRCEGALPPSCVIGAGIAPDQGRGAPGRDTVDLTGLGIEDPYILYVGRLDTNKGCRSLFDYFTAYASTRDGAPQLVLAGQAAMTIPTHPKMKVLGFVDDSTRAALMAGARVLVAPSLYESLCMVVLEAWNVGLPVLVNGRCDVLRGQTVRANGGLYYRDFLEFCETLDFFMRQPEQAAVLGAQGTAYVEREYRWPTVMAKLEKFLAGSDAS
jgi:glycosyltransferase involved in cell wall biosynthesis